MEAMLWTRAKPENVSPKPHTVPDNFCDRVLMDKKMTCDRFWFVI